MPVRDWNGASYDRISGPMEKMGRAVLDRLQLEGDETVLDAGCGSGRVTEVLIERLPRGHVIGVDGSESMVAAARARLGGRADIRHGDLTELTLETPVDAILSTATFHWIADHDGLFERLHAAVRPGGQLVAQCGGEGNITRVHAAARRVAAREPFAQYLDGWRGPWNFSSAERAADALRGARFTDVHTWLAEEPVTPEEPREYLATINLGGHLDRLSDDLHDAFIDGVIAELGGAPVTIDYVRLNIDARA
jgi:trans-aconitate 2-methyltransferase